VPRPRVNTDPDVRKPRRILAQTAAPSDLSPLRLVIICIRRRALTAVSDRPAGSVIAASSV